MPRPFRSVLCLTLALLLLLPLPASAKDWGFTQDYEPPDPDKLTDPVYSLTPLPLSIENAEQAAEDANEYAERNELDYAVVRIRNYGRAPYHVLHAMSTQSRFPQTLHADTTDASRASVEVRISFCPADAVQDMRLDGSTLSADAQAVKRHFQRDGRRVAVVLMGQEGSYGIWVSVAAQADLSGMNMENLRFYSWRESGDTLREIDVPGYRVDDNGFLHFSTWLGDAIVITDTPL